MPKTVSIIIPTYGRPALLARGLRALAAQEFDQERMQVLVVDDGSPEPQAVAAAVRPVADRMNLHLFRKPNGGLAATRMYGARRAVGDILLFMDDDILPCLDFVAAHMAVHERHERAVALGSLPHPPDLPVTPFLYYLNRIIHYDLFLRYGSAANIPLPPLNGNSSLHRRDFEATGGYDPQFVSYGGEDTDMGYRLRRAGVEFVYAPDAKGYHYHVKNFAAYRKDMYSSGVTLVAIVRKFPEVLERVNMDIVRQGYAELTWRKRAQKGLFETLVQLPLLVDVMNEFITATRRFGWNRVLYPFHKVVGHYEYGRGMRDEIARGGLG